jgi:hypothetical protein
MGVIARKSGESFIITSDRTAGELPMKSAPKKRATDEVFQVWTGSDWSTSQAAAAIFSGLEAADDYIRANFDRVMR